MLLLQSVESAFSVRMEIGLSILYDKWNAWAVRLYRSNSWIQLLFKPLKNSLSGIWNLAYSANVLPDLSYCYNIALGFYFDSLSLAAFCSQKCLFYEYKLHINVFCTHFKWFYVLHFTKIIIIWQVIWDNEVN